MPKSRRKRHGQRLVRDAASMGQPTHSRQMRATRVKAGPVPLDKQEIDFLFVLDVEATCVKDNDPNFKQEIIELPVVCIDVRGKYSRRRAPEFKRRDRRFGTPVAEFRSFIQPEESSELSKYCTKLTGIRNEDVKSAPTLRTALQMLHEWVDATIRTHSQRPVGDSITDTCSAAAADPGAASGAGAGTPSDAGAGTPSDAGAGTPSNAGAEPPSDAGAEPTSGAGAEPTSDAGTTGCIKGVFSTENPAIAQLESLCAPDLEAQAMSTTPCLLHGQKIAFATDGPWDLLYYMHEECERKGIPKPMFPPYLDKWVNLRWQHAAVFNNGKRSGVSGQLHSFGLRFEGREHSGIDDSRNIGRIATAMMGRGCRLAINDGVHEALAVKWTPPVSWGRKRAMPVPLGEYPPRWYIDGVAVEYGAKAGRQQNAMQTEYWHGGDPEVLLQLMRRRVEHGKSGLNGPPRHCCKASSSLAS